MFWEAALGNFYVVEITPGGDYSILRRLADKWITVVPRSPNQQINRGADAVNEIRVELVDNFGALFINNVKVQEFRGQPEIGGGTIGLYAASEPTVSDGWRFLDVAVVDNGKAKPVVLSPAPSGPTIPDCRPTNPTDFQDTFTKQDPAWGIGSNDTTVQYVDGQLLIKTRETTYRLLLYLPLVFKNATVCATVKSPPEVADLKANAQGALAFWASDYSNFYTASIYPNGAFFVSRRVHGNLATVVPWTTSDAIKKGVDAINLLQVVLKGTSASLYINGIKVTDFQGQPPPEGGATGLVAVSEAQQRDEWRFLNITVVENQ